MNKEFAQIAKTYKRTVAGTFILVDGDKIKEKVSGENFCVTKKLDGTMTILFYRDGAIEAYTSNGLERPIVPCIQEFAELCKKSGIHSVTIAAELYAVLSESGRERVCDVSTAIASAPNKLRLAPFGILDIEGTPYRMDNYGDTLDKLKTLFAGVMVKPVECKKGDKGVLLEAYEEWVVNGGAEGLVVHSELPIIYKVKPRHTIDCTIIGYTLGEDTHAGGIRNMMVAVMTPEGQVHPFTTVGSGFSDEQRVELLQKLEPLVCSSEFVETDSRNVAYQMVRPEIVVEISLIDLVAEDSKGVAKMTSLLNYSAEEGYIVAAKTPSVSAHSPVFIRLRDDKTANESDVRISQLTDLVPFSEQKPVVMTGLQKSDMLAHRIFTKGEGPKLMIQKFVLWKTNKDQSGFPTYVFHYTDYSVSRKEPLKRDIRVSNSEEQIRAIYEQFIAENIKKGWVEKE